MLCAQAGSRRVRRIEIFMTRTREWCRFDSIGVPPQKASWDRGSPEGEDVYTPDEATVERTAMTPKRAAYDGATDVRRSFMRGVEISERP